MSVGTKTNSSRSTLHHGKAGRTATLSVTPCYVRARGPPRSLDRSKWFSENNAKATSDLNRSADEVALFGRFEDAHHIGGLDSRESLVVLRGHDVTVLDTSRLHVGRRHRPRVNRSVFPGSHVLPCWLLRNVRTVMLPTHRGHWPP